MTGSLTELTGKVIFVSGHKGMVGSALVRRLRREGCTIVTADRAELDLTRSNDVDDWLLKKKPDIVIVAAAKVGGIWANDNYPAEFIHDNLMIAGGIIAGAHKAGVEKLLFLGSSCIYPRMAPQPIAEEAILTGPLEETNKWYAIAKIAGIMMCQAYRKQYGDDFISAMPTNLYGPGDNFDPYTSHVLPALIRKFHCAKVNGSESVTLWGSGSPKREFLHVDDCADALVFLLKTYSGDEHVNVGSGKDLAISHLAEIIAEVVGYRGAIRYDRSKPDGTPRKLMSSQKLASMGWSPSIGLRAGIETTYKSFLEAI